MSKKELNSLEQQLFTWEDWEDYDEGCYSFYKCRLIVDIGRFKSGTRIDTIDMIYSKSVMEVHESKGSDPETFDIKILVTSR